MKNALIDPETTPISYISGWEAPAKPGDMYTPIYTALPDSQRVAEVSNATFPVAPPLFWTECADDVVADQWYYDSVQQLIIKVPPFAPYPTTVGATSGVQSV